MHDACAAPLAEELQTYFLNMRVHLERTANIRHTVTATAHGKPILTVFARTQRKYYALLGHVFKFKFMFVNCVSDFSVKNYVRINHGLSYACRKLIFYVPTTRRTQTAQRIYRAVVCTSFKVSVWQ